MFLAGLVMASFWFSWWRELAGEVPSLTELVWFTGRGTDKPVVWTLPFGLSRYWDILAAPIFVLIISRLKHFDSGSRDALAGGLFFGLFLGLTVGLSFGLSVVVFAGLIIGLTFGLSGRLSVKDGLTFGISYSLVMGLYLGLLPGLVFFLVIGSPFLAILATSYISQASHRWKELTGW